MHARFAIAALALALVGTPAQASDVRLAQKVTYQGGYKRLHAIAGELSKQTRGTIRAGSSKQDWRVRDIPMVVCVKDMPLGTLLKTIADCAHVTFAAEKIAGSKDKDLSYRLYRTPKQQKALNDNLNGRLEANRKIAEWSWDTLAAYADMPDASGDIPENGMCDAGQIRIIGKMLKSLRSDAEARVMAGETITRDIGKSVGTQQLKSITDYTSTHYGLTSPQVEDKEPPKVSLQLSPDSYDSAPGFSVSLLNVPCPPGEIEGGGKMAWYIMPKFLAEGVAAVRKLDLRLEPDVKAAYKDADYPSAGFTELKTEKDWDDPVLRTKVKMPASAIKDGKRVPRELAEVAKQTGVNIICEDLTSHLSAAEWWQESDIISPVDRRVLSKGYRPPANQPDVQMTIAEVLKATHNCYARDARWFYCRKDKLVVGWISGWQVAHLGLMPESMYVPIRRKMETVGAELDDTLPLTDLSNKQLETWFAPLTVPYGIKDFADPVSHPLWCLYRSLDSDQKAAKSDDGLPLASLDPGSLRDCIQDKRLLKDHETLSRARLSIVRQPIPASDRHSYSAEIAVVTDTGTQILAREDLKVFDFPFYTRKRETELSEKGKPAPASKK